MTTFAFYQGTLNLTSIGRKLLPTKKKIKSGMTLLIELYLLHGKDTYIDRVVGWGVFPLCDSNFNILEGKFKCPFLRGHYDLRIDRFNKIEDLIKTDMDHWLCNLYLQIVQLPQYLHEQKEYDTFVQLPHEFLAYANHDEKKAECEEIKRSILKKQSSRSQGTNSRLFFPSGQGQPLASQRDPNAHKEIIPNTEKDMKIQLDAQKGEEENILTETQTKIGQQSLPNVPKVDETTLQSTLRNMKRKMCKKDTYQWQKNPLCGAFRCQKVSY
ncbi:uncharacterized protein LOC142488174 [Ascaphus truei]|uniref:uncharacterized protein LOC142488174 n=1 Tax=Ascaphus truei TaxID=8439 RepID=UPI003F5A592C